VIRLNSGSLETHGFRTELVDGETKPLRPPEAQNCSIYWGVLVTRLVLSIAKGESYPRAAVLHVHN
jgi:hypothetical protein